MAPRASGGSFNTPRPSGTNVEFGGRRPSGQIPDFLLRSNESERMSGDVAAAAAAAAAGPAPGAPTPPLVVVYGAIHRAVHWAPFPAESWKTFFQTSPRARVTLLAVSVLATAMVIGDGVLTPAISGRSECEEDHPSGPP